MKIEAIAFAIASYSSAFIAAATGHIIAIAAGIEQNIARINATPEDIFWPAFLGAAFAALWTIKPAFREGAETSPSEIAFTACVTMLGGFVVSYYFTRLFAPAAMAVIPLDVPFPAVLSATAVVLGIAGEKIAVAIYTRASNIRELVMRYFPGKKDGGN